MRALADGRMSASGRSFCRRATRIFRRDLHRFRRGHRHSLLADHVRRHRQPLPFAPKLKFNLGASQELSLGSRTLLLSGNFAYNSGYVAEPDNVVRQDAFATVDLSAEWQPARAGRRSGCGRST